MQQAAESHLADVQNSLDTVEALQLSDDKLATDCQQLLDETTRQLESTRHFHSSLDTAIINMIETEYDVVDSLEAPSAATVN